MTEEFPAISHRAILGRVGRFNYRVGSAIVDAGGIGRRMQSGDVIEATVMDFGEPRHHVRVELRGSEIATASCTCQDGQFGNCIHCAGVMIAFARDPAGFAAPSQVRTTLAGLSDSELQSLLKLTEQLHTLEPNWQDYVQSVLAATDADSEFPDPDAVRRDAAFAFALREYDYDDAIAASNHLLAVISEGDTYLEAEDCRGAITVYCSVAATILDYLDIVDELLSCDGGDLAATLGCCVERLAIGLSRSDDPEVRHVALRTLLEIHLHDLTPAGGFFDGRAGAKILEHVTSQERWLVIAWLQARMPEDTNSFQYISRQMGGRFLLELAGDDLDEEARLDVCRDCGLLAELANHLLPEGRVQEVIDELGRFWSWDLPGLLEAFERHGFAEALEPLVQDLDLEQQSEFTSAWLKRRHLAKGEFEEALAAAAFLFDCNPETAGYRELRALATKVGKWEEIRDRAIDQLADFGELYIATMTFANDGPIDAALELAGRADIGQYALSRLESAVRNEAAGNPARAAEYHRQLAEAYIGARGRANYRRACAQLESMNLLLQRLGRESEWRTYLSDLRFRSQKLPALLNELERFGPA